MGFIFTSPLEHMYYEYTYGGIFYITRFSCCHPSWDPPPLSHLPH